MRKTIGVNYMEISFVYKKPNGEESTRKIIVVHDTGDKFTGFDMSKLTPEEQKKVLNAYGKKLPTNVIPKKTGKFDYESTGVDKEIWTKAYRLFSKTKIK